MKPKRLPNGFGHISKLSGTRRRPYMARTSSREVIGYAETYEDAFALLVDYNRDPYDIELKKLTLDDIWELFKETEFENYSEGSRENFTRIYNRYLVAIKDKKYATLKTYHFTKFLNSLNCSDNVRNKIITLLKHLDDIAFRFDIIEKKYAHELKTKNFSKKKERIPFTEEQIETLWEHINEPNVDYILIAIYTGFRLNELLSITVDNINFKEWTITGGSKTEAGKNRIVPVHERIRPLILNLLEKSDSGRLFDQHRITLERRFKKTTKRLLGRGFIPHEARYTMRTRLDNVGANKVCIDRIMGHKSGDTGMDVYTHKTIDQLHEAVALLK